jgi:hypothetical protein
MSSFKKLSKADITNTPYAANKQWGFNYTSSYPNDSNLIYYLGKKEDFSITGLTTTNGQYVSSIYSSINHLFYQEYSGSLLDTGSLMFNVNTYQSASEQRPTGSYFNYNINPNLVKDFPSIDTEKIAVISINQDIFGSKILPNTFRMSSSLFNIVDDGNGNLKNGAFIHVGNIFYAQGIAVLTNQQYINVFPGSVTGSCSLYSLSGTRLEDTIYYFTSCSGVSVTKSISDVAEQACIDTRYPITKVSGPGDYSLESYSCISGEIFNFSSPVNITFQNEHIIQENEVRCIIRESEYNLSYNPTLVTGSYSGGDLRGFATSESFSPYVTTVGLYNDDNDLLMVAKLSKPLMISPDTDMTFIVKYDT